LLANDFSEGTTRLRPSKGEFLGSFDVCLSKLEPDPMQRLRFIQDDAYDLLARLGRAPARAFARG
jgi:hypothetical protein